MISILDLPSEILLDHIFPLLDGEISKISLVCTRWLHLINLINNTNNYNLRKISIKKNCSAMFRYADLFFNLGNMGRVNDIGALVLGVPFNLGEKEITEDARPSCLVIHRLGFDIFQIHPEASQRNKMYLERLIFESMKLDVSAESKVINKLAEKGIKLSQDDSSHYFNEAFYEKLNASRIENFKNYDNLTEAEKLTVKLSEARFYQRQIMIIGNSQISSHLSGIEYTDIFQKNLDEEITKIADSGQESS